MKNQSARILLLAILLVVSIAATSLAKQESVAVDMADYTAIPPFVLRGAAANVLLNLSVEWPTAGAAYNDEAFDSNRDGDFTDPGECDGRVTISGKSIGKCYFKDKDYLGYFDPNKCYTYSNNRFEPAGATINDDHECSAKWSGNFLNWATMSAIDELRWAVTGGHRQVDTSSETALERANVDPAKFAAFHRVWQVKVVSSTSYNNVTPSTVTPFSDGTIYVYNHGYEVSFFNACCSSTEYTNLGAGHIGTYYARVKVCDPAQGLEDNCVSHSDGTSTYFKPEGLMQKNDNKMRFAAMGYLLESVQEREGGVLRANMKYVGPKLPDGTDNPNAEYGEDGIFVVDPDNQKPLDVDVQYSGVINYLNRFGRNGYKSKDPVSELFYECLNYYKNRGPTANFLDGDNDYHIDAQIDPIPSALKDGFPVITNWDDPIQHDCQQNYIIGINDAFPHVDKRLPGTSFIDIDYDNDTINDLTWGDYGEPANADPDYSVTALTNTVGQLQGINGTQQLVGCTPTKCDWVNDLKTIPGLGQVAGPRGGTKHNSWYIAGLAYYANSEDIRSDLDGRQSITTYMMDTQEYTSTPYKGEMNMLWLTGKYGGFVEKDFQDTNSDGNPYEPNLQSEWDEDGDGEPDNYVLASDPGQMVRALNKAFTDILNRASSGTAASVIASTRTGAGAVYQTIFHPYYSDVSCNPAVKREVEWVGEIHGLFVDPWGNMREDTNTNRTLDLVESSVGADDRDLIIIFDGSNIYKLDDDNENGRLDPGEDWTDANADGELAISEIDVSPVTMGDVNYIWSTNDWLNELPEANIPTQRGTYLSANNNRYIFTFIDKDGDMVPKADGTEEIAFTTANIADIGPYLHLFDPFIYGPSEPPPGIRSVDYGLFVASQANRVVDYIRGKDQPAEVVALSNLPAMRNRQVDYDCDNTAETWRLGDVIHSSPTVVATPAEDYDLIYKDKTYADFFVQYKNRRHVVYVGANDGMLHAFNGGFFDPSQTKFSKAYHAVSGYSNPGTAPELGAELWAYVPYNLLPHLYWLTDPTYSHVYYVDLKPKVFDARIFPTDATHPNGWGTVMVVGMRLGGGPIKTDKDHDGNYEPNGADPDKEMRSAYVILDITDPESPPTVLAEITFDDLGFTTSYPAVIVMDPKDTMNANDWYLILGSGPTDITSAASDQRAKIYIIDLKKLGQNGELKDQSGNAPTPFVSLDDHAIVGDLVSVDLDLDYKADVVYFGTSLKFQSNNYKGRMHRLLIENDTDTSSWDGTSVLFDAQKPITAAPTIARDRDERIWVYFGTGRFLTRDDVNYLDQQSYFGIKEPLDNSNNRDWSKVLDNGLLDVSDVKVFEGGEVKCDDGAGGLIDCANITDENGNLKDDFDDIETIVDEPTTDGWKLNFAGSGERNLGQGTLLGEILTFTTYTPNSDPCEFEGFSNLYALHYKTGTAFSEPIIGFGDDDLGTKKEVAKMLSLGKGLTLTPNIHVGREEGSKAFIQTSTGAIEVIQQLNPGVTKSGKASWRED